MVDPITTDSGRKILVIDETLREGMQYQGVMFSLEQRIKILQFQEKLGVDICQAGYPPAHGKEAAMVKSLVNHVQNNGHQISIAAMGRLTKRDAEIIFDTGAGHFHFHIHIDYALTEKKLTAELEKIVQTAENIKNKKPSATISIAMLDLGRTPLDFLQHCIQNLDHPAIDILSLPDTSGIMAPNRIFEKISGQKDKLLYSKISIHCHNDMGMANANTVMGILGGGDVLEATALGIGERNGLADLFTAAKHLKAQGYKIRLDTDDMGTFRQYYTYVDQIVFDQTGHHLINPNTPVFGEAVKTHVAGTHSSGRYGLHFEEKIFLNALCGKGLVKKFLDLNQIRCPMPLLGSLTRQIKSKSYELNRHLTPDDVKMLIATID